MGDLPICRLLLEKRASLTHASATGATAWLAAKKCFAVVPLFSRRGRRRITTCNVYGVPIFSFSQKFVTCFPNIEGETRLLEA